MYLIIVFNSRIRGKNYITHAAVDNSTNQWNQFHQS